jgi:hypothetical protein
MFKVDANVTNGIGMANDLEFFANHLKIGYSFAVKIKIPYRAKTTPDRAILKIKSTLLLASHLKPFL